MAHVARMKIEGLMKGKKLPFDDQVLDTWLMACGSLSSQHSLFFCMACFLVFNLMTYYRIYHLYQPHIPTHTYIYIYICRYTQHTHIYIYIHKYIIYVLHILTNMINSVLLYEHMFLIAHTHTRHIYISCLYPT